MKAVVRAWTTNLDTGNNVGEARLFSLPVLIETGPDLAAATVGQCWCLSPAEIVHFHAQMPCSVKIVSITVRGRHATAVLRLGDRLTSKCSSVPGPDTTGWLTGLRFKIVRGKITAMGAGLVEAAGRDDVVATLGEAGEDPTGRVLDLRWLAVVEDREVDRADAFGRDENVPLRDREVLLDEPLRELRCAQRVALVAARNGAAWESNPPSRGLHGLTGFEDSWGAARNLGCVQRDGARAVGLSDRVRDREERRSSVGAA
jgi:hypothetical protein